MPPRRLALQRSMSARVMVADELPQDKDMWVENEAKVWVLTDLISQQNTQLKVRRKDTGEVLEIDLVSSNSTIHSTYRQAGSHISQQSIAADCKLLLSSN